MYHEFANYHCEQKEWYTRPTGHFYAVPHGLDPLAAQHTEDDHERVEKVHEIPAGQFTAERVNVLNVVFAKHLLANHGENEYYYYLSK